MPRAGPIRSPLGFCYFFGREKRLLRRNISPQKSGDDPIR
jgi:hypothetical protein